MAKEEQNRVLDLIEQVTGTILQRESCPRWLLRPGRIECGQDWESVQGIYRTLTGLLLPDEYSRFWGPSVVCSGANGQSAQ